MTDLQETFHTNRTYLSNFVNRTYKVNFSCYINRLRLSELRRLQNLPSNAGKLATRLMLRQALPLIGLTCISIKKWKSWLNSASPIKP